MYTPGTLLRLAREERKLSITEVKQFAKIRESAIVAMETDEFERFPAAYMQTFLPSYADFLGVSQYKLAEAFKATLPEYGYLARSLYSRTLQQIAFAQVQMQWERDNPPLFARATSLARKHSARLVVVMIACVLGWSVLTSDLSLIGTLFAPRFVATPEDMRGTPFTELTGTVSSNQASESASAAITKNENTKAESAKGEEEQTATMQTIHLASLVNIHLNMDAVKAIAFKQTARATHSVGEALVKIADDIAPPEPMKVSFDPSRRSISSIAASMLAQVPHDPSHNSVESALVPRLIRETAIEQHSERSADNGQVLVEGLEDEPLNVPSFKRKKALARVMALTASFGSREVRVPDVATVTLQMPPRIERVQLLVPMMRPSKEYQLREIIMTKIPMPTIIVPAFKDSVEF